MSDVYVEITGDSRKKIEEFKKLRNEFWDSVKKLCKELGSTGRCCTQIISGELRSIEFTKNPGKDWKKDKGQIGFYMPKLSTKRGKELSEIFQNYIYPAGNWLNKNFLDKFDMSLMGIEELNNKYILICNEEQAKCLENKGFKRIKKSEYYAMKGE